MKMTKANKAQKAKDPAPVVAAEPAPAEAGAPKEKGLEQSGVTGSSPENIPSSGEAEGAEPVAAEAGGEGAPDPANVEAVVAVLLQRIEDMEVMLCKLERKVAELEDKLYGVAKDAKLRVKDGESLHGKVDDLRI